LWTSLKRLLPSKIRGLGLEKEIEFFNLKKNWDNVLGDTLGRGFKEKSRPEKLKNGVLVVNCLNSVWANELQMREEIILEKIKKSLAKPALVEKIRFIS